ncbi:MAG: LLM class flavin-dependent oxidoreductase [Actinomycetes bacterium]
MAPKPELGVLIPKGLTVPDFLSLAVRCESVGIDSVWLAEDCFTAAGPTMAAMILERTEHLKVSLGILPAVSRNVAFTAMEMATLANAHPGRLTVGIGHGLPEWMRQIGAWPSSPLAALGETITVLQRLLRGERVTFSGRHVVIDDVQLDQPPSIVPDVLAGVRGPRSLELSGRLADGTILSEPSAPEYVLAALDFIAAGKPDATKPHRLVVYNWYTGTDAMSTAALRATIAQTLSSSLTAQLAPLEFGAEALERSTTQADPTGNWLPVDWLNRLAIWGDAEMAASRVTELAAAGAGTCVLAPVPGANPNKTVDQVGLIARLLGSS